MRSVNKALLLVPAMKTFKECIMMGLTQGARLEGESAYRWKEGSIGYTALGQWRGLILPSQALDSVVD